MKKNDLSGQKFTRLLVIKDSGERSLSKKVLWNCLCDCGNICKVKGDNLRTGNTRSCGCLQKEEARKRLLTHGKSGTREYNRALELRKYGMTLEDLKKLYIAQDNKCKICDTPESELKQMLHVDHCHKTGKVRGLLCYGCNSGLGGFKDNVNNLRKAIEYLTPLDNAENLV